MAKRKPTKKATARRAAQRAIERQAIAESIRASERAGQARRRRDERESIRESERERVRQEKATKVRERGGSALDIKSVTARLIDRFDDLAALSPYPLRVHVVNAPTGEGLLPWLLLGEFISARPLHYSELTEVFEAWEADYTLTARIGPQRLAWIRWVYQLHDKQGRPIGEPQGYSDGGAGAYDRILSESAASADPGDDEPSRENTTTIGQIELYFSADTSAAFFETQAAERLRRRRRREK